jgi:fibronectin-binding autotransporter adhesin
MANRYWVGGTALWDATAGTKWAATSGGAGGEAAPTATDDVFLDAASGAVTVTISGTRNAKSLNCTGFTGTLTGATTPLLLLYGDLTLNSTMTVTFNGWTIVFGGSSTIIAAGKNIGSVTINGAGIVVEVSGAFTFSTFTVTQGTLNTNGYSITGSSFTVSGTGPKTINLGATTLTTTAAGGSVSLASSSLTFNAGTSNIFASNSTFAGGGQTFYNVELRNLSSVDISGDNTFNDLTLVGRTTSSVTLYSFAGNQTITGTLAFTATANATVRKFLYSSVIGTTRTLTCAAVATPTDIDFRDITIAGAAAPLSGTRLSDCKGNSGITFDAAKTVYYRATGSASWGASTSSWALSSGGTATHAAFPLAQDTAIFPAATYPSSGSTTTVNDAYNIGTIDMSLRTSNTMTLATGSQTPTAYGNWINGTGTTLTGTGTLTFAGRGTQTITSTGKTWTQSFSISTPGGSVALADAFTSSASGTTPFNVDRGTFSAAGYNFTLTNATSRFTSSNSNVRTVDIGSGTWTLAGVSSSLSWSCGTATNLTVTGTGTISLTSASAKTFAGGGIQTYPTLNQGGTGALTVTGSNKFDNITNTAIGSVLFTGGTTNEFGDFNLNGTSTAVRLTVGSTNTTQAILKKPGAWNVGAGSLDGGNNTGLSFI